MPKQKKNIGTVVLAGVLLLATLLVCIIPAALGRYVITMNGRGSLSRLNGSFVDFNVTMIAVANYKETFSKGDTFDPGADFVAVVAFTDNTTKDVTGEVEFSGFDSSTAGVKIITVSYTYPQTGKTVTTTYEVRIMAPVKLTVELKKNLFDRNETLLRSNFTVKAIDSLGLSTVVSSFNISAVDMSTVGTKTVTISDPVNNLSTTCTITVMNLTIADGTALEKDLYWFFNGVFCVSSGSQSEFWPMYEAYLGGGVYTGGNGETVTGFTSGLSYVGPNGGGSPAGAIVKLVPNAYDLTIDNALPYTMLGIGCIAGYSAPFNGYGYYINGDTSTLNYFPIGGVYTAANPGGIMGDGLSVYDHLGPYNGHAWTHFSCYSFEPGETYTVTWVAVFDDCIQTISNWTVNMKEKTANDAVFVDTAKPNANVIVLAGQSNMYGVSPITQDVRAAYGSTNYSNVFIRYNNINVDTVNGGLKTYYSNGNKFDMYALGIGAQSNSYFGPEAALANALATSTADDEPWYIIKYAAAGTGLKSAWLTGAVVNGVSTTLFQDMKNYVQDALTAIEEQGYEVQIHGLLWMQGENDALVLSGVADEYHVWEEWMVTNFRSTFAAYATRPVPSQAGSGIAFIDAGIADYNPSVNAWEHAGVVNAKKVSNCQELFCNRTSEQVNGTFTSGPLQGYPFNGAGLIPNPNGGTISNSIFIDTHFLKSKMTSYDEHGEYSPGDEQDGAHYGASSMIELGECFALCFLYMFGK